MIRALFAWLRRDRQPKHEHNYEWQGRTAVGWNLGRCKCGEIEVW